jgi:hypothetical protein
MGTGKHPRYFTGWSAEQHWFRGFLDVVVGWHHYDWLGQTLMAMEISR